MTEIALYKKYRAGFSYGLDIYIKINSY